MRYGPWLTAIGEIYEQNNTETFFALDENSPMNSLFTNHSGVGRSGQAHPVNNS